LDYLREEKIVHLPIPPKEYRKVCLCVYV